MTKLIRRLRKMDTNTAAAFWVVRADSGELSPREAARFEAWLSDTANLEAYRRHDRVLSMFDAATTAHLQEYRALARSTGKSPMKPMLAKTLDLSAIGLSALCLLHCLALPVLAVGLPLLGTWARAEWVHVAFVSLAAPIALLSLMDWSTMRPSSWRLVAMGATGLGLMLAGAVEFPAASWERPMTVAGGLLLATAHIFNWRKRHAGHAHSL